MEELTRLRDQSQPVARRVLAVDDDPDLLRLIRRELEKAGFEVWAAASAEDALGLVKQKGLPHLALVDILLPGIDGLALARKLHEWSDLPIVMLSGLTASAKNSPGVVLLKPNRCSITNVRHASNGRSISVISSPSSAISARPRGIPSPSHSADISCSSCSPPPKVRASATAAPAAVSIMAKRVFATL